MKQWIAALLVCTMMLIFVGCHKNPPIEEGPAFYYCTAQLNYGMQSKSILSEHRADAQNASLEEALSLYLAGPKSETLRSPFHSGLKLVDVHCEEDTLFITMNDALAELSGLDLSIVCCCLSLTGMELTGAQRVTISAEDSLLNGQKSITMDNNSLLLLDTVLEGES